MGGEQSPPINKFMKSKLTLTEKEVQDIVRKHFEDQGYVGIKDIKFDIATESRGYGEYDVTVVRGMSLEVDVEPVIKRKK